MKVIGERAREKISGKKLFGALILIPILAHRDLEGCVQYNPTSILESITLLILALNYLFLKYSLLTIRLLAACCDAYSQWNGKKCLYQCPNLS